MSLLESFYNQGRRQPIGGGFVQAYYIDATNGDDNNEGRSPNKPWQTIAKVNGESFSPGDRILFKRGETFNDAQLTCDNAGAVSSLIVYGSYGSGAKPLFNKNDWNPINVTAAYVELDNLAVTNATGFGVLVNTNANNSVVSDCDIYANYHEGIRIDATSNITISGGSVYGNGTGNAVGIRVNTAVTTLLIDNVTIYCDIDQEIGILFYDADGSSDITLRDLNIYDHLKHGVDMFVNPDGTMDSIHIVDCIFNHNGIDVIGSYRGDGLGVNRSTNILVERCIFKNNLGWGADFYQCDVDVINCLFYDNQDAGVEGPGIGLEINSCEDANVYHNTFYSNETGLFSSALESGGTYDPATITHTIKNNINYDNSANDFDEDYTDKPAPCVLTVTRSNYLETDPSFVNPGTRDLHLQSGSDARNAGADLDVADDYDKVARDDTPDIGAYEYVA